MKTLLLCVAFLMTYNPVFAVDYTQDANCMGAFIMEEDGNESDVSGEGNTLTETSGDIPQSADKKFGTYSRDFESGDTEYLTHGDSLSTDISGANQAMSIVLFTKRESDVDSSRVMLSKWDNGAGERQYILYTEKTSRQDSLLLGISNDGAATVLATGASETNTATWYHYAGVYNDTDIRVYLDGSLDSNGADNPKAHTSGINDGAAAFSIGSQFNSSSPSAHYDGLIDDAAIFNRELTSVEVSDINTNGLGYVGVTANPKIIIIQ